MDNTFLLLQEETENEVLNLMLGDILNASEGINKLRRQHFVSIENQKIFTHIKEIFLEEGTVGVSLVKANLRKKSEKSQLDKILATSVDGKINALCDAVINNYKLREIDSFCRTTSASIGASNVTGSVLLDRMQKSVLDLTSSTERGFSTFADTFGDTLRRIGELQESGEGLIGLPTGIAGLDRKIGGISGPKFIVIGGRPSDGKTEFILNILTHMAFKHDAEVAFFSLEMGIVEEINIRIASSVTEIPMWKLKTGNITAQDEKKLDWLHEKAQNTKIHICADAGITPSAIHAKVKRLKIERPNLAIVAVDYLQLLKSDSREENRNLELGSITRGMKLLAMDLGIPVIAASQMARRVEQRKGNRPKLSDLRDSGAIEADADIVIFCQRPSSKSIKGKDEYTMRLVLEKQRNGPIGTVLATNNTSIQKIYQKGTEVADPKDWDENEGFELF